MSHPMKVIRGLDLRTQCALVDGHAGDCRMVCNHENSIPTYRQPYTRVNVKGELLEAVPEGTYGWRCDDCDTFIPDPLAEKAWIEMTKPAILFTPPD